MVNNLDKLRIIYSLLNPMDQQIKQVQSINQWPQKYQGQVGEVKVVMQRKIRDHLRRKNEEISLELEL